MILTGSSHTTSTLRCTVVVCTRDLMGDAFPGGLIPTSNHPSSLGACAVFALFRYRNPRARSRRRRHAPLLRGFRNRCPPPVSVPAPRGNRWPVVQHAGRGCFVRPDHSFNSLLNLHIFGLSSLTTIFLGNKRLPFQTAHTASSSSGMSLRTNAGTCMLECPNITGLGQSIRAWHTHTHIHTHRHSLGEKMC